METGKTTTKGRLSVIVSNDGFNAWVECRQADQSEAPPTKADVMAVLETAGVAITPDVHKRADEYLRLWTPPDAGAGPREVPQRYLIAQGTPPVDARDDVIEYNEKFRDASGAPGVAGTVDYFARSQIRTVEPEAIIGYLRRAEPAQPGEDVFGRKVQPKRRTGAQITLGHGLKTTETGALVAEVAGRLIVEGQRLRVEPELEIRGDIDFDTGSVESCVDVTVHGTVKSNFHVRTKGSLNVGRAIEASEVDVGGDLRVQGGICGREGGPSIRVGGAVTARFCNESVVQAGGQVCIEAETLNSRIHTPGLFRSPGGTIIGGTIWAREGIEISVLGSESCVTTTVAVGVELDALREQRRMEEQINGNLKLAAGIREKIAPLIANLKRLTASQREAATELMSRANELEMAVDDVQTQRQQLHDRSRPSGTPYIIVNGAAHRGVRISFGGRELRIDHVLHGPVRIEERKVEGATEIVAVNQRTASVTVLPSWEIDLSAPAPHGAAAARTKDKDTV